MDVNGHLVIRKITHQHGGIYRCVTRLQAIGTKNNFPTDSKEFMLKYVVKISSIPHNAKLKSRTTKVFLTNNTIPARVRPNSEKYFIAPTKGLNIYTIPECDYENTYTDFIDSKEKEPPRDWSEEKGTKKMREQGTSLARVNIKVGSWVIMPSILLILVIIVIITVLVFMIYNSA